MLLRKLGFVSVLLGGIVPALGQTPASGGLDPALLAKANAGDASAQVAVGESYAEGKGIASDRKQAAEWFRKAADKENIDAEMHLAALYRDGSKELPRDMTVAAAWYRKAAEQGNPTAQATLGTLYSLGQGVPQARGVLRGRRRGDSEAHGGKGMVR